MTPEREWWQNGTLDGFKERIAVMLIKDLEALSTAIGGKVAIINGQLGSGNPDAEWRQRAVFANGMLIERRSLVRAELQRRNTKSAAELERKRAEAQTRSALKRSLVQSARARLESGDVAEVLEIVLDLLDGSYLEAAETEPRRPEGA